MFSLKKLEGNIYFLFGIWKKTETLEPTHVMPQTQWENTKKTSTFKVPLLIRIHSVFLVFPTQTKKSMDFFTFMLQVKTTFSEIMWFEHFIFHQILTKLQHCHHFWANWFSLNGDENVEMLSKFGGRWSAQTIWSQKMSSLAMAIVGIWRFGSKVRTLCPQVARISHSLCHWHLGHMLWQCS